MKDVWGHSGSMDQSLSEQLQLLHCLEVGQKRLLKAELVPVM